MLRFGDLVRIPLTPHGTRELLILTLILGALATVLAAVAWPLALPPALLLAFAGSFFRDPERALPGDPEVLVSPADGTVTDVRTVEGTTLLEEPCLSIGIFLSVFNVHVNRAPLAARVERTRYRRGEFLDARHPDVGTRNECNDILLRGAYPVVVRQIAGLIARRIVFPFAEGTQLERGQRMGMIKFGSRTELYVPLRVQPVALVRVGEKVRGAATPLVRTGAGEQEP